MKLIITNKEKSVLRRVLAIIFLIGLCGIFIGFNMYIIDQFNLPSWIALLTGFFWWVFAIPVWHYYC